MVKHNIFSQFRGYIFCMVAACQGRFIFLCLVVRGTTRHDHNYDYQKGKTVITQHAVDHNYMIDSTSRQYYVPDFYNA